MYINVFYCTFNENNIYIYIYIYMSLLTNLHFYALANLLTVKSESAVHYENY